MKGEIEREREREKDRQREGEREIDRQTDRQSDRDTQLGKKREGDKNIYTNYGDEESQLE